MILSVGLFFLTLIIIITLRKSDRNEHRLEHVKRYVGGHLEMLKNKDNELLAHISEYESGSSKHRIRPPPRSPR